MGRIFETKHTVFNYDEIPVGYYYKAMLNGSPIQRFWHRTQFEEVAKRISPGSRVLDFGCGPGSFLSVLGDVHPNVSAIGVDIVKSQIDFANSHIASKFENGRISFLTINSPSLPFGDNSFDFITCVEVIEHIHPFIALRIFSEIKRVLKPNGRILVVTPNYNSMWPLIEMVVEKISPVKYHDQHISKYTPNSLVKFLESAGFQSKRIDTIFVVAPFTAPLSRKLASSLHAIERKIRKYGSLIFIEASINPNFHSEG